VPVCTHGVRRRVPQACDATYEGWRVSVRREREGQSEEAAAAPSAPTGEYGARKSRWMGCRDPVHTDRRIVVARLRVVAAAPADVATVHGDEAARMRCWRGWGP
jgi:hypothetical protein